MEAAQIAVFCSIAGFIGGLVFQAGRMSARVDALEAGHKDHTTRIASEMKELTAMLRAAIGERRNWREAHP